MFRHYHLQTSKEKRDQNYQQRNPNMLNYRDFVNHAQQTSYFMNEFSSIYEFPTDPQNGLGQTCGIIQLGGGIVIDNVKVNLAAQGLPTDQFTYEFISIDGAPMQPGINTSADEECELDFQNVVCLAPYAHVRVYFAFNSDVGFYNAIHRSGIIDKNSVTSISWGAPEFAWSRSSILQFNALFQAIANINGTVFAASGDNGSSDGGSGNNVDYPASSPFVWGCGGTTLHSQDSLRVNEYVWNNNSLTSATGGGLSKIFSSVSYQTDNVSYPLTARGIPDGSGPADPNACGSKVFMRGQWYSIGGTSAVSPIMSGLTLRLNQKLSNRTIGFPHPVMYPRETTAFYDIITGNNGAFFAQKLYDLASGLGSPIGVEWLAAYQNPSAPIARFSGDFLSGSSPLTVMFVDGSSNQPTEWHWDFGVKNSNTGQPETSTLQNPTYIFLLPAGQNSITYNVTLTVKNEFGESSVMHMINVSKPKKTFPVWAIIVLVILILFIFIVGIYFGIKHTKDVKAGKIKPVENPKPLLLNEKS